MRRQLAIKVHSQPLPLSHTDCERRPSESHHPVLHPCVLVKSYMYCRGMAPSCNHGASGSGHLDALIAAVWRGYVRSLPMYRFRTWPCSRR